ncbi:MAG TPA: AraC family transcriptional regulator [Clostridiaceae bacterium]|nr:AraC family transcriptional regulator [Clostridiaceae bacterium]
MPGVNDVKIAVVGSINIDYTVYVEKRPVAGETAPNETVADFYKTVHMSPTYLSSEFKKQTGKTLSKYIIEELKINKAKEYLAFSDMRIQDISEELGFSDYRYFCTVFKNETNLSPLSYRANNHR